MEDDNHNSQDIENSETGGSGVNVVGRTSAESNRKIWISDVVFSICYGLLFVIITVVAVKATNTSVPLYMTKTFVDMGGPRLVLTLFESFNALIAPALFLLFGFLNHTLSLLLYQKDTISLIACNFLNYEQQLDHRLYNFMYIDNILSRPIILCTLATLSGINLMGEVVCIYFLELLVCFMRYYGDRLLRVFSGHKFLDESIGITLLTFDVIVWGIVLQSVDDWSNLLGANTAAVVAITFLLSLIDSILYLVNIVFRSCTNRYPALFLIIIKSINFLTRFIVSVGMWRALAPDMWKLPI